MNPKTGRPRTRDRVCIRCDNCASQWTTTWAVYQKKILNSDYCRSCKNKLGISGVKGGHSQKVKSAWKKHGIQKVMIKTIKCDNCQIEFQRCRSQINTTKNFCSTNCRCLYNFDRLYNHLFRTFKSNQNDVAYLTGLMLGDGGFRASGSRTTYITISFDIKQRYLIDIAETALNNLKIHFSTIDRQKTNVAEIKFHLPRKILASLGIDIHGSKNRCQPFPFSEVIKNINFIGGLINSDGYHAKRQNNHHYIQLTNTTESIIKAFCQSLDHWSMKHRISTYHSGNANEKTRYDVFVSGSKQINLLCSALKYPLKRVAHIA